MENGIVLGSRCFDVPPAQQHGRTDAPRCDFFTPCVLATCPLLYSDQQSAIFNIRLPVHDQGGPPHDPVEVEFALQRPADALVIAQRHVNLNFAERNGLSFVSGEAAE